MRGGTIHDELGNGLGVWGKGFCSLTFRELSKEGDESVGKQCQIQTVKVEDETVGGIISSSTGVREQLKTTDMQRSQHKVVYEPLVEQKDDIIKYYYYKWKLKV